METGSGLSDVRRHRGYRGCIYSLSMAAIASVHDIYGPIMDIKSLLCLF